MKEDIIARYRKIIRWMIMHAKEYNDYHDLILLMALDEDEFDLRDVELLAKAAIPEEEDD